MMSLSKSLVAVVLLMVVLWFVGRLLGFHISLLGSIAITVVLTLAFNVPRLLSARKK